MSDTIKVVTLTEYIPADDKILVQVDGEEDRMTASGIVLAGSNRKTKQSLTGTIRAMGPGRMNPTTGQVVPSPNGYKVGQRIHLAAHTGYLVDVALFGDGKEHKCLVVMPGDLLGKIVEEVEEREVPSIVEPTRTQTALISNN